MKGQRFPIFQLLFSIGALHLNFQNNDVKTDAAIIINEIAPSGGGNVCSGEDWIELYNDADTPSSLVGYVLHDDKGAEDEDAKTFGANVFVQGVSYLLLCRDDGNGTSFAFGIGRDDTVTLLGPELEVISTTGPVPEASGGDELTTYAFFSGSYAHTATPTPGAENELTVPKTSEEVLADLNALGLDFFRLNDDGTERPSDVFEPIVDMLVTLPTENLAYLRENKSFETYVDFHNVTVRSNGGAEVTKIGGGRIRTKGQSTLSIPACMGLENVPFRIKFNGGLFGMKDAYLRNHLSDQSYVREYTLHRLNGRFGLPFLKTRHVRLYLNGDYVGLYTFMEAVDQPYVMQRSFGPYDPEKAALFKVKTQSIFCTEGYSPDEIEAAKKRVDNPPDPYYFERGEHRDPIPELADEDQCFAAFIGNIFKERNDAIYAYVTHGEDCAEVSIEEGFVDQDLGSKDYQSPMKIFLRNQIFAKPPSLTLPDTVDVDQWLRNIASYAVTIGMDSPINNMNNWYIASTGSTFYPDWKIVQYDHNNIIDRGLPLCSDQCFPRLAYWPIMRPSCKSNEEQPILASFLTDAKYIQPYLGYVREFVNLMDEDFFQEIRTHIRAIGGDILNDPLNAYTAEDLELHEILPGGAGIGFVALLEARKEQVVAQLDAIEAGTLPLDGIYGKNEVCPDWRDDRVSRTDYLDVDTLLSLPDCEACALAKDCFSTFVCSPSGEFTFPGCEEAAACAMCYPYSPCGSFVDDTVEMERGDECDGEKYDECVAAAPCFSHRSGQCAFDGEILEEECKQSKVCSPCFTKSRCGSLEVGGDADLDPEAKDDGGVASDAVAFTQSKVWIVITVLVGLLHAF